MTLMMDRRKGGWYRESGRHALAAKGIKTGRMQQSGRKEFQRIDTAKVAKLIRGALKDRFPDTKFSVRTSRYSLGSSIDVFWVNGPATEKVQRIIEDYERVDYDEWGGILSGGNRFVFAKRDYTPEVRAQVQQQIASKFRQPKDWQEQRWQEDEMWRTLQKNDFPNHPKARLDWCHETVGAGTRRLGRNPKVLKYFNHCFHLTFILESVYHRVMWKTEHYKVL